MYAVDVSNFSGGPIEIEQARLIRDVNRRIVIGCQDVDIAVEQTFMARQADLEIQHYIYFYTGVPIEREFQKAREVISKTGGGSPFVWLDFEDVSTDVSLSQDVYAGWVSRILDRAQVYFGVGRVGVYTGRGWWEAHIGNTISVSFVPLWDADWSSPDLQEFSPYGGWDVFTMKQYAGDFDLFDMRVNLSVY